jgi:homoserine dehydrogenase
MPTASAVVADIIDAAKSILGRGQSHVPRAWLPESQAAISLCPMDDIETRYYVRLVVMDEPGVLAQISSILGKHRISIASVIQKERHDADDTASIVMVTHHAIEKDMQKAMREIDALDAVKCASRLIRIEEEVAF